MYRQSGLYNREALGRGGDPPTFLTRIFETCKYSPGSLTPSWFSSVTVKSTTSILNRVAYLAFVRLLLMTVISETPVAPSSPEYKGAVGRLPLRPGLPLCPPGWQ